MKKILKSISIILTMILIFSSCSLGGTGKIISKIQEFITNKQYNECLQYIDTLKDEQKSEVNSQVLDLVINDYRSLVETEKVDLSKLYVLNSYSDNFLESCRKLWNIASVFSISKDAECYIDYVNLRFFAITSDFLRYREIYSLMFEMKANGYIEKLNNKLYQYDTAGDTVGFDELYEEVSAFDYGEFDPQQYLISDFRTAHDNIVKNLKSLSNGFATDDSTVVASAVNELYSSLNIILEITDYLKFIRAMQISIYNDLPNDIYREFNTEIQISAQEYYPGVDFALDYLFDDAQGFIDEEDISSPSDTDVQAISLEQAIDIACSAVNKTKIYNSNITVGLTLRRNIVMTSFGADTNIDSAIDITKSQVNTILDFYNGTGQKILNFTNGVSFPVGEAMNEGTESVTLNEFVPPKNNTAYIDSKNISNYTIVEGNGGYVITFTVNATESSTRKPVSAINTFINGFEFDGLEGIDKYSTFYSPTEIILMINPNGLLTNMQYTLKGVSDCTFASVDSAETVSAEFTFDEKYLYQFTY